ncbi:phospholipase-like protein [Tanacetum coccineum]
MRNAREEAINVAEVFDQIQPQVGLKSFQFRKNTHGKPEVDWEYNNDWDPPRLHFNMSHTSSLIACGMTIDSPIGIDVEEKKRTMKNKILSFAKRYFTNEEVEVLRAISDPKVQRQEFNKLWTLKEAYIKALGRGFSGAPFNTFTLRFWSANPNHEDSDVEIVPVKNQSLLTTNCQFAQVDLAGSHYAAIFTETNGGEYLCLENSMLFTTGGNMSGLARRASLDDKEEMTAPSWEKRIAYALEKLQLRLCLAIVALRSSINKMRRGSIRICGKFATMKDEEEEQTVKAIWSDYIQRWFTHSARPFIFGDHQEVTDHAFDLSRKVKDEAGSCQELVLKIILDSGITVQHNLAVRPYDAKPVKVLILQVFYRNLGPPTYAHQFALSRLKLWLRSYALNIDRAAQGMPMRVAPARIVCLDFNLQKTKMQLGVQVLVTDPRELKNIRQREANVTKERIENLIKVGANVVLTTKGIDDMALKYFVETRAIVVRRVRKEDLRHVAKATGATVELKNMNKSSRELIRCLQSIDGNNYPKSCPSPEFKGELPEFLGGSYAPVDKSGYMRSDKGPWHNQEIIKLVLCTRPRHENVLAEYREPDTDLEGYESKFSDQDDRQFEEDPALVDLDRVVKLTGPDPLCRQMLLVGGENENVPLYYHMYDNFQIQFGREEFCLVTGLKFGVEYSDDYDDKDKPIPFRRRVFPSRLDGKRITGKDVEDLIDSNSFKKLDDDDAVSLCCIGILQLVLLGLEDRRPVHNWILRLANDRDGWDAYPWGSYVWPTLYYSLKDANVKRWLPLYATESTTEDDKKTYSLLGFTWAFKTWILEVFRLGPNEFYTRHMRYPRIVAWTSNKKFYRPMLRDFLHGRVPAERLIPDEVEAGSGWWLSSRAYYDGCVTKRERRPPHLNRENHYEVPSDIYREFQEQRSGMDQMMKQGQNIVEAMKKYMEELNVDTRSNREPIIADHYQQAWRGKDYCMQQIRGSPYESFEMLPYYCYNLERKNEGTVTRIKTDEKGVFEMLFIALGASIRTFVNYLRPLLIIDAAHLKGQYKGTNLIAVGMDGNNQIVPIAFGICKGETGPCWSWWMAVLKECIGDNPSLLFISDRHAAIALAVQNEFPLAYHAAYTTEEFSSSMSHLQDIQPDAYDKLCQLGPQRWSRAHCPLVRYNYLTSNSVESVNACTVVYRKLPVLKLAETYRAMSPPVRRALSLRLKLRHLRKVRVRRKDADISSGIGLHVPRYTQLLAESSNEL